MRDFLPRARVIADSEYAGCRLTTMEVYVHRFTLPALICHRELNWLYASTGDLPVATAIRLVADEPALPVVWPCERAGVIGGPPVHTLKANAARDTWLAARDQMVEAANTLADLDVHKSVVNRLLEPFLPQRMIVTGTDWHSFFVSTSRSPSHAEPLVGAEIVAASEAMWKAAASSKPEPLEPGQWHLPFLDENELVTMPVGQAWRVSASRLARTLTRGTVRGTTEELALWERLLHGEPPNYAPLEHVAYPAMEGERPVGNFRGWHQLRYTVNDRSPR